jgi:arylsulfatase
MIMRLISALFFTLACVLTNLAHAMTDKPNILVIWGDDIGFWNISHNRTSTASRKKA